MTPTKLSPEELEMHKECARTHEAIDPGRLLLHVAAMEAEHRALLADNAALAHHVRNASALVRRWWMEPIQSDDTPERAEAFLSASDAIVAQTHPGAALISELHDLRARVEMMGRASWYADFQQEQAKRLAAERERDEARAQVATARAAALEEAATRVGCDCSGTCDRNEASAEIRALATTPPPPVVPVAKVRTVLRTMATGRLLTQDPLQAVHVAADALGITLDGEP